MSDADKEISTKKSKKSVGRLAKEAEEYREKIAKRGVIYLSRVPPFMKPNKARSIFEQYGEVTRLYLAEEDPLLRRKRKENGGNGSKQFSEGWIEFSDKKVAKQVAESLNNSTIGGKKSDFYHDDIWNIKYLKNFKWDYLTEKFAYEKRVKENKLKVAMNAAKRSNAEMTELIEKTRVQKHISDRKRQRGSDGDENENHSSSKKAKSADDGAAAETEAKAKMVRKFRQTKLIGDQYGEREARVDQALLKNVFGKSKSGGGGGEDI